MNLADAAFELPSQITIVEWGAGTLSDGLPTNGESFDSGWFDCWRLTPEDAINQGNGTTSNTGDDSVLGSGKHRRAGLYVLDIFCRHVNTLGLSLLLEIRELPTPAMVPAAFVAFTPRQIVTVPSAGTGGNLATTDFVSRSFRIRNRMVNLSFTYPASNAGDFYLSACLRSA